MLDFCNIHVVSGLFLMRHNQELDNNDGFAHVPVFWREVLEYLEDCFDVAGKIIVDSTLGEGGHSELILKKWDSVRIIAFERDEEILSVAKKRLQAFADRIEFVNDDFMTASQHLAKHEGEIAAILYDFGISSYHYERSGRGFSFNREEPLDMRLDHSQELTAEYIVNRYSEKELTKIFSEYGQERWSRQIARYIVSRRSENAFETTFDLAALVLDAIPRRFHVKNIHPATRIFQALRIAVNSELNSIEESLRGALQLLAFGGRIIAISFHSLEDRIVKNIFKGWRRGCTCGLEHEFCKCDLIPLAGILTKKPIRPTELEVRENPRSRSARLRVCERIAPGSGKRIFKDRI